MIKIPPPHPVTHTFPPAPLHANAKPFFHFIFPNDIITPTQYAAGGAPLTIRQQPRQTLFQTLRVELAENLSQRRPRRVLPLADLALDLILTLGQLFRHNLLRHLTPRTSACHSRIHPRVTSRIRSLHVGGASTGALHVRVFVHTIQTMVKR